MVLGNPTIHNTYSHSYSLLLVSYVHNHGIFPLKKMLSITSAGKLSQQLQLGISWVLAGPHTSIFACHQSTASCWDLFCSEHGEKRSTHTQKAIKNAINPLGQNNTCEPSTVYKSIYINIHFKANLFFCFVFSRFMNIWDVLKPICVSLIFSVLYASFLVLHFIFHRLTVVWVLSFEKGSCPNGSHCVLS